MLIKSNSLEAAKDHRLPHVLGARVGPGKYAIQHPEGCDCGFIYSVNHARWVTYNGMSGEAQCNRCFTKKDLPMPAVRENYWSKRVFMDIKAIEDDLWRFQQKHENCEQPPSETPGSPPPAETR